MLYYSFTYRNNIVLRNTTEYVGGRLRVCVCV